MISFFTNSFIPRYAFVALYVGVVLWCTGSVMRESDQASVIAGSLEMARDGAIQGRDFYNYDKTYGTYWILSSVYKGLGLEGVNSSPEDVIKIGNQVAAGVFLLGLVSVFVFWSPTKWYEWIIGISCLLSPVLLFSAPLLSSNVISAGFLFALIAVLTKNRKLTGDVFAGVLSFCAVAARADAVLVMPLLACLSTKEGALSSLLRDRRLWIMAFSCLVAIILGRLIYSSHIYEPATFFKGKLFIAFFVFAMNGGGFVFIIFLMGLCRLAWRDRAPFYLMILGAMILPILFYGRLLYSPRHLMTTVLVVLISIFLLRGREIWARLVTLRWIRLALIASGGVTVLSSFIGLRMNSFTSGQAVVTRSTLYPTADGFWPMGANFLFFTRLQNANSVPIDHNQRVWRAWASINEQDLPSGNLAIESHGLISYGKLRLIMLGRGSSLGSKDNSSILIDGRSLLKNGIDMNSELGISARTSLKARDEVSELSSTYDAAVFCLGSQHVGMSERWEVLKELQNLVGGDDYLLMQSDSEWNGLEKPGPFRWFFVIPSSTHFNLNQWIKNNPEIRTHKIKVSGVREIYSFVSEGNMIAVDFSILPKGSWVARSALAAFMQIKNY